MRDKHRWLWVERLLRQERAVLKRNVELVPHIPWINSSRRASPDGTPGPQHVRNGLCNERPPLELYKFSAILAYCVAAQFRFCTAFPTPPTTTATTPAGSTVTRRNKPVPARHHRDPRSVVVAQVRICRVGIAERPSESRQGARAFIAARRSRRAQDRQDAQVIILVIRTMSGSGLFLVLLNHANCQGGARDVGRIGGA
jgi:hypothetical protein